MTAVCGVQHTYAFLLNREQVSKKRQRGPEAAGIWKETQRLRVLEKCLKKCSEQCASVCVVESRGSWEPGPEAWQPASPQDCTTSTLQHTHRCAEGNGHSDGHTQTRHTDGCLLILEQLPWWVSMLLLWISVQTTAVRVSLTWKRLRTDGYRMLQQAQSSSC